MVSKVHERRDVGNRRGLGKLKWLWVHGVVKEGRVKLKTVKSNENVADHGQFHFLVFIDCLKPNPRPDGWCKFLFFSF